MFFGGFGNAEYGATDVQLQSDIAQLLVTTSALYDAESAVRAAIDAFGKDTILTASRRLTKSAVPKRIRESVRDAKAVITAAVRRSNAKPVQMRSETETITRFTRSQVVQLVLLGALVYVAYPFISTVPTFFNELRTANWWWALLGLAMSALTYVGAAAALWACADGSVSFWRLSIAQVANTFAATTTPAGVGGLALSTRLLQKSGLSTMRATAAVALQQSVQVIMHIVLLIFFSTVAGASTDLSHFVPDATVLYLIAGVALGIVGDISVRAQAATLAGDGGAPPAQGGIPDLIELGPRAQATGADRTRLYRNDSRCSAGAVVQRPGLRRRRDVRHRHRGDDGRRHAGLGRRRRPAASAPSKRR